jgi:hypothetical protein
MGLRVRPSRVRLAPPPAADPAPAPPPAQAQQSGCGSGCGAIPGGRSPVRETGITVPRRTVFGPANLGFHSLLQGLDLARLLLEQGVSSRHLRVNHVSVNVPVRHPRFLRIVYTLNALRRHVAGSVR